MIYVEKRGTTYVAQYGEPVAEAGETLYRHVNFEAAIKGCRDLEIARHSKAVNGCGVQISRGTL